MGCGSSTNDNSTNIGISDQIKKITNESHNDNKSNSVSQNIVNKSFNGNKQTFDETKNIDNQIIEQTKNQDEIKPTAENDSEWLESYSFKSLEKQLKIESSMSNNIKKSNDEISIKNNSKHIQKKNVQWADNDNWGKNFKKKEVQVTIKSTKGNDHRPS